MAPTYNVDVVNRASGQDTIEECRFLAALSNLDGHFMENPTMGPRTAAKVAEMILSIKQTVISNAEVRTILSKNVRIWNILTRVFGTAVSELANRSLGPPPSLQDSDRRMTPQESNTLIVNNFETLKYDLDNLNELMFIARCLIAVDEPEIPQDLCAAVHFDQSVYQIILLCINVSSKGSDGEMLDTTSQNRLIQINDAFKRLLVLSLQHAHNWTVKHDRNKMSFWLDVLFDYDIGALAPPSSGPPPFCPPNSDIDTHEGFRVDYARSQVRQWLESHSNLHPEARQLLFKHTEQHPDEEVGGMVGSSSYLNKNWTKEGQPTPDEDEYHRSFGKVDDIVVSKEIESWYAKHRACHYVGLSMTTIDNAKLQIETCKQQRMNRCCAHRPPPVPPTVPTRTSTSAESSIDVGSEDADDYGDDDLEEDDGLLAGIMTEIPNILDPQQIEALHMIVKSCIVDMPGSNPILNTRELQKTRCKIFLALDCGKSLLREMLVFIAVWEIEDHSLIFKVTNDIIEAIHNVGLIPYAWQSLRIPKDIMSPAQTILLRMVYQILKKKRDNYLFEIKKNPEYVKSEEFNNDLMLIHFLFHIFRWEVIPECLGLLHIQALVKDGKMDPMYFPVDLWDMDRAKEGLTVFLDLLVIVADIPEGRARLIEWESIFDLVSLLSGLDSGVAKKPLVSLPNRFRGPETTPSVERPYEDAGEPTHMQELAHKFPWSGLKAQIFTIIAHLLQPPPGRNSPGNPVVQQQIVRNNGIVPLLNSCSYDDYNPFAKERVTICLKWLLDGCDAANNFFRELISLAPSAMGIQTNSNGKEVPASSIGTNSRGTREGAFSQPVPVPETTRIRVDGIEGEINVEIRKRPKGKQPARRDVEQGMANMVLNSNGNTQMENDLMS